MLSSMCGVGIARVSSALYIVNLIRDNYCYE